MRGTWARLRIALARRACLLVEHQAGVATGNTWMVGSRAGGDSDAVVADQQCRPFFTRTAHRLSRPTVDATSKPKIELEQST